MVRTYKRKKPPVDTEALKLALDDVRRGESIKGTARNFGLNRSLIQRHLKGKVSAKACQGGIRTVFTSENEDELVRYAIDACERCYGLSRSQLARLAYQLAVKNNIPHPFNNKEEMAGRAWVEGFLKRHPELSFRKPSHINMSRSFAFTKDTVNMFFDNLESVITSKNIEVHRIYNIDESGCSTVPNSSPSIMAPKVMKNAKVNVPAERGQLVSMVCACNPTGHYIPPMFIFARVRGIAPQFIQAGPEGCVSAVSKEAYMTGVVFLKYLEHFKRHVKPTQESPVLIVMDNHVSHITIDVIDFCIANHIFVVTLPPHTSHMLQPLDLIFFSILKTRFGKAWWDWMCKNPGKRPRDTHIPELMKSSYNESASVAVAANSFKKSGIWDPDLKSPNRNVFSDRDFAASRLRSDFQNQAEQEEIPEDDPTGDTQNLQSEEDDNVDLNLQEPDPADCEVFLQSEVDDVSQELEPGLGLRDTETTEQLVEKLPPSNPSSSFQISPFDIAPTPCSSKSAPSTSSRKQFSEIITSSEYRQRVLDKAKKKSEEIEEKARKKAQRESAREEKRKLIEEEKERKRSMKKQKVKEVASKKVRSKVSPDITQ